MRNFLEKIMKFMYGRNGFDKLSFFLLGVYFVFSLANAFKGSVVLYAIQFVFVAIVIFRTFSKNISKRQKENEVFERFIYSLKLYRLEKPFRNLTLRLKYIKTHRFRRCPNCKENLRLKRKVGKRDITCPKCGFSFKVFIAF